MESTIDIVLEKAKEYNFKTIKKITLNIGELSGVMDESLNFAFKELKKDTILEEAELYIDKIKATAYCEQCNKNYHIDHFNKLCPKCGSFAAKIVNGYELYLYAIEGE
jgi:hydrogenase nickel incorporation protein HypA/HybF